MSINLKLLAQKLKLSQTTVSRALNGYPEVSEATRRRVEDAALAFGYRPNGRARGLATGRAFAIGHVIPTSSRHETVNPVFADFASGVIVSYAKHGYDMVMSFAEDGDEVQACRALAARAAVDGLVIQAPRVGDERIAALNEIGIPYVVHGRASGVDLPYSWVDVNNRRSFLRATELLIQLGHRRIALINGIESMDFAARRRAGYLEALSLGGLTADPELMRSAKMTEHFGWSEARAMLAMERPPTAILAASVISGIGVRRAIEEAGLVMGRDVSVIIHDDDLSYLKNGSDVPIFTATRSSVREAGIILGEMLISQIRNPGGEPQSHLLESELILGRSTGPAKQEG